MNSSISIEKFAAFLDGNLEKGEMDALSRVIEHDNTFSNIFREVEEIDSTLDTYPAGLSDDGNIPADLSSMDFDLPSIDNNLEYGDRLSDLLNPYSQDILTINAMNEKFDSLNDHSIFGDEGINEKSPFVQQFYSDTCAIRSQQIIMRDYGIDISEHDLREIAIAHEWYEPGQGTSLQDVGNIMDLAGVGCHRSMNNTVYDLVSELSQGHRVIVGVDSGELWSKTAIERFGERFEDFIGVHGADHALIVAGVDVNPNDPKDIKIILTDPGSGDLRIEYRMGDFIDAWKDSNCFMVSTDEPAPYQFDPATGSEVPSGFQTDFSYNSFVMDNGYELSMDDLTIPDDYLASFGESHDDTTFNVDNDFDDLDDVDLNA